MAPVRQKGQAPPAITTESIGEAIRDGLARGDREVQQLEGSCADRDCWIDTAKADGQDFVLLPEIEWKGPDQLIKLTVVDVASGEQLAVTNGLCEICGQDEFLLSVSNVAAQLLPRLDRLGPEPARLAIDGRPEGATIEIDGEVVGTLPWEGEIEAGEHTLRISHPGHAPLSRSIVASPGVSEMASLELMTLPDNEAKNKRTVALGASLIAAGVVGVGLGGGLFALDGRPYRSGCVGLEDVNGRCPRMYETTALASVAVVVGGAALITGSVLLIRALRKGKREPSNLSRRMRTGNRRLGLRTGLSF